MTRDIGLLALLMFLFAAVVCLNPGGLHCHMSGQCGPVVGITAALTGLGTVALLVGLIRGASPFQSLLTGPVVATARPAGRRGSLRHLNNPLRLTIRVFLL